MKPGDLVRHAGGIGLLVRKLQYETDDRLGGVWNGNPAWWALFINQTKPRWAYEDELTLVKKGN